MFLVRLYFPHHLRHLYHHHPLSFILSCKKRSYQNLRNHSPRDKQPHRVKLFASPRMRFMRKFQFFGAIGLNSLKVKRMNIVLFFFKAILNYILSSLSLLFTHLPQLLRTLLPIYSSEKGKPPMWSQQNLSHP